MSRITKTVFVVGVNVTTSKTFICYDKRRAKRFIGRMKREGETSVDIALVEIRKNGSTQSISRRPLNACATTMSNKNPNSYGKICEISRRVFRDGVEIRNLGIPILVDGNFKKVLGHLQEAVVV